MNFKNVILNNFNDDVIITSSRGKDLKIEVRAEARKHNKNIEDFQTKPYNQNDFR
jgi:hypothetical protein